MVLYGLSMRLATYNVNSIRARLPRVLEWLAERDPDIVAVQETKVEDDKFPYADIEAAGYTAYIHGQKSYNGVAFLSKVPLQDVEFGFCDSEWRTDCRIIRAVVGNTLIVNTYVPNGTAVGTEKWDYKLAWLDQFPTYMSSVASPADRVVWLGDINIAPTEDDVYEPERHLGDVGHHPDEFSRLAKIVDWGFTDVFRAKTEGPNHYTFWDFRIPNALPRDLGWRIDHIYASDAVKDSCRMCVVDKHTRALERPSDHAPLVAEFDWE